MYREVCRIERDFLYDPGFHGLRPEGRAGTSTSAYLDGLGSRHDLNYLLDELLGGLSLAARLPVRRRRAARPRVASAGCSGPTTRSRTAGTGSAGSTAARAGTRTCGRRSPSRAPDVKEGEYLLAVNGRNCAATTRCTSSFEGTAGKQTVLKVGPNADGKGSREVTVVPVAERAALRNLAWVDANRRAVDRLTNGKVAYVYLPDTADQGYTRFNRYFFAQAGRDGVDRRRAVQRRRAAGRPRDRLPPPADPELRDHARGSRPAVPDVGDLRARR